MSRKDEMVRLKQLQDEIKVRLKQLVDLYQDEINTLKQLVVHEKIKLHKKQLFYHKLCEELDEDEDDLISVNSDDEETEHEWPVNSGKWYKGRALLDMWEKEDINEHTLG